MDNAAFFAAVRSLMPGKRLTDIQVKRIEAVLDILIAKGVPLRQAAYILGTAHHESDRFKTLEEYASGKAYEGRKTLGNTVAGDGVKFKGRGFVQVTGRRNYTDWSKRLGVDLLKEPTLAASLDYAPIILIDGMLLGTFTGRALSEYVEGTKTDYRNARRVVNGIDKAALIAGYAESYADALRKAGYIGQAPRTLPTPLPKPPEPVIVVTVPQPAPTPEPAPAGFWARLWKFLIG